MAARVVQEVRKRKSGRRALVGPRYVDLDPTGREERVRWQPVPGMTSVEVSGANVLIGSVPGHEERIETLADLPLSGGVSRTISLPGEVRVRALRLHGYENLVDEFRLVVSTQRPGAPWVPSAAFPNLPGKHMIPQALADAKLNGDRLTFPSIVASKMRLSVATGSTPPELVPQPFSLSRVDAEVVRRPGDLTLLGPGGTTLWSLPGEQPENHVTVVDLSTPLRLAFQVALDSGADLEAAFRLTAKMRARARFDPIGASGFIVREISDTVLTTLKGDPVVVSVPGASVAPPTSATATARVRYKGVRVLPEASDREPIPRTGSGPVVAAAPVTLCPPARSLVGHRVAELGLIGRCAEDSELSVTIVGEDDVALAPPGVVPVEAGSTLKRVWVPLDMPAAANGPVRFKVRASVGSFHWIARGGVPSALVAVHDPDPNGRPVRVAGSSLVDLTEADWRSEVDVGAMFSAASPIAQSELFVDFDLSNLLLRYRR